MEHAINLTVKQYEEWYDGLFNADLREMPYSRAKCEGQRKLTPISLVEAIYRGIKTTKGENQ